MKTVELTLTALCQVSDDQDECELVNGLQQVAQNWLSEQDGLSISHLACDSEIEIEIDPTILINPEDVTADP